MIWRTLIRRNSGEANVQLKKVQGTPEGSDNCSTLPGPVELSADGTIAVINVDTGCEILANTQFPNAELDVAILEMLPRAVNGH